MEQHNKVNIQIELELFQAIEKEIVGKGFSTVEDYVNYTLHTTLAKRVESNESQAFNAEDSEKVTSRLKALGYI